MTTTTDRPAITPPAGPAAPTEAPKPPIGTATVPGRTPADFEDAPTMLLPPIGAETDTEIIPVVRGDEPAAATPARARRRSRIDVWLMLTLLAVVLTVQGWNITRYPSASDDEGTYLAQSWAVQHGLGLAHYTYWYDHPPLGWIQLAALTWLPALIDPDGLAVGVGRFAMLLVTAIILALVYVLSRRIGLARWAAALAVLVCGLSPLSVTMQRQIYLDSFAVAWLLAALVLARSPRKHLWHFMAAGSAAAIAVLSKETMLLAVPAVVVVLWQSTRRTAVRPYAFAAFFSGLVLIGVFYPLYALLKGELLPGSDHVSLIAAWQFQLQHRTGSGWILSPGTGSNSLLHSWLYYDTVILFGGVAATVLALGSRRLRGPALAGALLTLVALRPGGYLPAMYVIQVLPLFAIAIAGVAEVVVRRTMTTAPRLVGRLPRYALVLVLAALAGLLVVPRWVDGDRTALTADANSSYVAAAGWMRTQLPDKAHTTVVVDDVLWLDLVRAGYPEQRVIWFYKLDLDSAVAARLPDGWRDVDYLVSTPAIRQDPSALPTVAALMNHSTVVVTFGSGEGRIEIRRVKETP